MLKKTMGFTLIELLITVSIIAILSAIGLIAYSAAFRQGNDSKRQSDLRAIQSALEQYYTDQLFYPDDLPASGSPLTSNSGNPNPLPVPKATYLNSLPADPDSAKRYCYSKAGNSYELCAKMDSPGRPVQSCTCGTDTSYNFKLTPP